VLACNSVIAPLLLGQLPPCFDFACFFFPAHRRNCAGFSGQCQSGLWARALFGSEKWRPVCSLCDPVLPQSGGRILLGGYCMVIAVWKAGRLSIRRI